MKPFHEWGIASQISAAGAAVITIGAVVTALSSVLALLPVVEPITPATHSFVRSLISEAQAADSASYDKVTKSLVSNAVGILDLKLIAIDGQIDSLNNQLNMIKLKLADPQGADQSLLSSLAKTISDQIDVKRSERSGFVCERVQVQFPGAPCTP